MSGAGEMSVPKGWQISHGLLRGRPVHFGEGIRQQAEGGRDAHRLCRWRLAWIVRGMAAEVGLAGTLTILRNDDAD